MDRLAQEVTRSSASAGRTSSPTLATVKRGVDHPLLRLQRSVGNRAVLRLLNPQSGLSGQIQRQPTDAKAADAQAQSPSSVVVLGTAFITNAKPTDEKFALRLGSEDAQTIRSSPTLTAEFRSELNAKLGFFRGNAKTIYGDAIKPALEAMGGGVADIDKIDKEFDRLLKDFTNAAHDGIHLFVHKELSNRIDQLESGSIKTFLLGLLGNGIWAATVFLPVEKMVEKSIVFAVAAFGIGVAAAPGAPSQTTDPLPEVEQLMYSYFDAYEAEVKKIALARAATIIRNSPAMHVNDIIAALAPQFFRPDHYTKDPIGKLEADAKTIRNEVTSVVEDKWNRYKAQIVPIGKHNFLPAAPGTEIPGGTDFDTQLVWAAQGGSQYLTRIVAAQTFSVFPGPQSKSFDFFIDDDLKDSATARANQLQPSGIPVVAAKEIQGFPGKIPGKIAVK